MTFPSPRAPARGACVPRPGGGEIRLRTFQKSPPTLGEIRARFPGYPGPCPRKSGPVSDKAVFGGVARLLPYIHLALLNSSIEAGILL